MPYLSIKDGQLEPRKKGCRKLTPKMMSFINAYFGAASFNSVKALELSDYNCKTKYSLHQTAAELMNHPGVLAEIARRNEKREKKSEMTAEFLISKLMTIIEDPGTEEKTADRLRAIELAGRAIALWKDRQELTGADGGAIRHEQEVKNNVADFTSRISSLVKRNGTDNVVEFPERSGTSGT